MPRWLGGADPESDRAKTELVCKEVSSMHSNSQMTNKLTWLVIGAISKNEWCGTNEDIRLAMWSEFPGSPDVLRNYLCRDGSGYVRGYYDGEGTFYVERFHLRDEMWTEEKPSSS